MAESVNRRAALNAAWSDYWSDQDDRPPINHYFECGFDAAWDALLSEIRPLVADLKAFAEVQDQARAAIDRLRELVREDAA